MILTCPECSARYLVDPQALLPNGRVVRCAKCKHSWREAAPEQDIPLVDSTEAEGPSSPPEPQQPENKENFSGEKPPAEETSPASDEDEFAISASRRKKRPRPMPKGSNLPALQNHKHGNSLWGWYSLAGFVALIVSSFLFFQSAISEIWPPSQKLYDLLGMTDHQTSSAGSKTKKAEPKIPLKDLFKIEETTSNKVISGQNSTLNVEGKIVSLSDRTQTLPLLRIALMDDQGTLIREWTFKSSAATIGEDEIVPFSTSLPNPPQNVTRVSVTFVEN